jgi:hydrogenase maturation protease
MKSTAIDQTESGTILVIGYGNTLRCDDGAGQRVAEIVDGWDLPQVRSVAVHQLTPELAADLATVKLAIFVDVYISQDNCAVQVQDLNLDLSPSEEIANCQLPMGHTAQPRSLLTLTQQVYGASPSSYWILIPGICFEFGESFSDVTNRGIEVALEHIILEMVSEPLARAPEPSMSSKEPKS